MVVVGGEVVGSVVDDNDPSGGVVININERGGDRVPPESFGGLSGVVPGEDRAAAGVDDDRPVLAVGFK